MSSVVLFEAIASNGKRVTAWYEKTGIYHVQTCELFNGQWFDCGSRFYGDKVETIKAAKRKVSRMNKESN